MYRVELKNISKSFGGIAALQNVTLKIHSGEIHALVGENGAGKSTLMKILSGACAKDSGKISIDGTEVQINDTSDSKKLGIGIIYQEFSLVPDLSVAENIFLSQLNGYGRIWLQWKKMKKKAENLINSLGFSIDPSIKVEKLSIAHQQIVEIVKALSENTRILILDEPSAVLGPQEIKKLFETLKRLKNEGVSIIYISHHLSEIFQLADRASVLKDGKSSESLAVSGTDRESIIKLMLGRKLETMFPERNVTTGREIIRLVGVHLNDKLQDISFSVKKGEVLGLAGLVGSGRSETVRAIFGVEKISRGHILFNGDPVVRWSPHRAKRAGIGMVPEDRKQQGIILSLSVRQNISLADYRDITDKLGFINEKKERARSRNMIKKLSIKTRDEDIKAATLSGGNQQKMSLAKWISRDCSVMIIDEPTRGIDVGAKIEIYKLINELTEHGVAVIVVSSETAELMGICDRIVVMRRGKIQGELNRQDFSEEDILRLSIGA